MESSKGRKRRVTKAAASAGDVGYSPSVPSPSQGARVEVPSFYGNLVFESKVNPSVTIPVGNGFAVVSSRHSKNSESDSVGNLPSPGVSLPHPQPERQGQTHHRTTGIQPTSEGQIPTSLRGKVPGSSSGPLYPLRPMQFPLPDFEFRLACVQCFKENAPPTDVIHTCHEDFLVVCNGRLTTKRWRLIREPKCQNFKQNYSFCRFIFAGVDCPRRNDCRFAHSPEERQMWDLHNRGSFRIDDFIASNRTPGSLLRYTVEAVYKKHPGVLAIICRACLRQRRHFTPQELNKEQCIMGMHDLNLSRILAHYDPKSGKVTLINQRPFKSKNAFFNQCRYGRFCRRNTQCVFAHSLIEYEIWYVERDSNLSQEQIKNMWQTLCGASDLTLQGNTESSFGSSVTEGARVPGFPTQSYSSVAARKSPSASESATLDLSRCPFILTRACSLCLHNGRLSGKGPAGDRCERSHMWEMNKVYVLLPSKKVVRRIPQQLPRRRRMKFYMCRRAKGDCRYASSCIHAHNDEELRLWNWLAQNNVNSLDAIIEAGEKKRLAQVPSSSSSSTTPSCLNGNGDVGDFAPFPFFQTAPWFCDFCNWKCNSQMEFQRHSSTVTHQFNVSSDKDHQWNFRQPPWNVPNGSYRLCSKHVEGKSCSYSHVTERRNYCTFAHSEEELDEWKERYRLREMKRVKAREDNLFSYMARLVAEYDDSGSRVLAEEVEDVVIECQEPLSIASENKLKVKDWTFKIHTTSLELQTVALLHEENFLHFALLGKGLEENCQICNGEEFQTDDTRYEVKVRFTGGLFGSFRQWVVFDFGQRPILVRKLSVELGRKEICEKVETLREQLKFDRWTMRNRTVVSFDESKRRADDFNAQLLSKYKEPTAETVTMQQLTQTQLNCSNYKHRMHSLIAMEEMAQAKKIATVSLYQVVSKIGVTNCIQDEWGGMQFSQSGQLFGRVNLDSRLLEGSLISSSSVSSVLLGQRNNKVLDIVFEATIAKTEERALKGRDHMYLILSKRCCEELELTNGDEVEVEIQFQLDRSTFCRMHFAIDQLKIVDMIFPDNDLIRSSAWETKYLINLRSSKLNEDQKKVVNFASVRRQQPSWPLVIYGPFGTGKTETLAEAAILLTSQNPDVNILICTLTNQAADEYTLRYFHPRCAVDGNFSFLRVYDKFRRVETTDPEAQGHSLISYQGTRRSFKEPTETDVRSKRIIVTTLETSLVVARLDLRGHFTHIFIDEAAQANECRAIMPLCLADEKTCVVLAGDHIQMSEPVHSEEARNQNFHVSLVERLVSGYFRYFPGNQQRRPVVLFNANYRSHPQIVRFVSKVFYGGENSLKSVGEHSSAPTFPPLAFHAAKGEEKQHTSSTSFYNEAEIFEVLDRVREILLRWPTEWGEKKPEDVLVTTPYTDQVQMIRYLLRRESTRLEPGLKNVAVLKVQNVPGKEFRAVLISTVRTRHLFNDSLQNQDESLGFLGDEKLLNSALTRARSHVAVIGDPVALCGFGRCSKIWRQYLKHCAQLGSLFPHGLSIESIRFQVQNEGTGRRRDEDMVEETLYLREQLFEEEGWSSDYQLPTDEIVKLLRN